MGSYLEVPRAQLCVLAYRREAGAAPNYNVRVIMPRQIALKRQKRRTEIPLPREIGGVSALCGLFVGHIKLSEAERRDGYLLYFIYFLYAFVQYLFLCQLQWPVISAGRRRG